jgi:uncharacterized phage protein gp47/JayE
MAIPQIPTIQEIKDRIVTDITGKINQGIPVLPLSFVKVLSSAIASVIFLLYQAILWVYKQIFPQSANYENLKLLGSIVGISPVPAVSAVILCTIPGTTGAWVYAGETFIASNNITYRVTTDTEIIAGNATNVPLLALTSGKDGNLDNGEILNIVRTNLSLTGTATVTGTQTTRANEESQASISARVIIRYRTRYITGSTGAYVLNGLKCPNFIWIGPYADTILPGKVNVYGRVDNTADGIPTTAQLTALLDCLTYDPTTGKAYLKPIGDTIECLPISNRQFDIEVFINAGSPTINALIETALNNYIYALEPYIEGVSVSRKNVMTNSDATKAADSVAVQYDAKVIQVVITDVITALVETNYTLYGGEFAAWRNITFTATV